MALSEEVLELRLGGYGGSDHNNLKSPSNHENLYFYV